METDFWNRISRSLHKEKQEIAHRYNIIFGQTEIYCARCKRPCLPGHHLCQDLTLIKARETRSAKTAQAESDKLAEKENLLQLREDHQNILVEMQDLGIKKLSILLMLPKNTVNKWIQRGKVPDSRLEKVLEILRGV